MDAQEALDYDMDPSFFEGLSDDGISRGFRCIDDAPWDTPLTLQGMPWTLAHPKDASVSPENDCADADDTAGRIERSRCS